MSGRSASWCHRWTVKEKVTAWEQIVERREAGSAHGRILPVVRGKAPQTRARWECRPTRTAWLTDAGRNCKRARRARNAELAPENH